MTQDGEKPLVAIVGPTASGKSALGVWLALRVSGEVVACDSTQLYRGFDVGTAKPPLEERRGVPHHLVDVLDPTEEATAGGYRERAVAVLNDLRARNVLPIFTVGTGLYLRVLLEGLADLPLRSEELRGRLRDSEVQHGPGHLHKMLERLDRASAKKIAAADVQKLIRAVEICLLTNKPLSEVHKTGKQPLQGWRPIKIGLTPERGKLNARVAARTEAMLKHGWLEEVNGLVASGLSENAKPFDFIGYRELRAVLRNEITLNDACAAIEQATRQYAKRQATWFRREADVRWLTGFGDEETVQQEALRVLREAMAGCGSGRAGNDV